MISSPTPTPSGALAEFLTFGWKQARARVFAGSFLAAALAIQVLLLVLHIETLAETAVLTAFHLLGFRRAHGRVVGLMIAIWPPRLRTRDSKSEVPPGPSPVGFSSQTRSAWIFAGSIASTRAVLIIQRFVRA